MYKETKIAREIPMKMINCKKKKNEVRNKRAAGIK